MRTHLIMLAALLSIGTLPLLGGAQANADAILECTVTAQAQITAWVKAGAEIELIRVLVWAKAGASVAASAAVHCKTAAEESFEQVALLP